MPDAAASPDPLPPGSTPRRDLAGQDTRPTRPAWIELRLDHLAHNFQVIRQHLPPSTRFLSVVKANAYGHGMLTVAKAALSAGASFLGVATLEEGIQLRSATPHTPILLLGERHPDELPSCLKHRLRPSIGDLQIAHLLHRLALEARLVAPVHLKINTGMNRYGIPWDEAANAAATIRSLPGLSLEGVMSHFAMSDESDKSYALEQLRRFNHALLEIASRQLSPGLRHLCNTGGFLDLPQAHFDMVRLGILPLGVYPSAVCQRLPGLQPTLSLKARLTVIRELAPGEPYGYGLRYRTPTRQRIGILPLGYGDGYPRLRNQGHVRIAGSPAPIIGGVAMDAIGVNLSNHPQTQLGDEAVLLGTQQTAEISARTLAEWAGTVGYDLLARLAPRLPRLEIAP